MQAWSFPISRSTPAGPPRIPTGFSSIRCRRPMASRFRSCSRRSAFLTSRISSPWGEDGSQTAEFKSLNPNGKIPAIIDPDGPGGEPIGLFESGAILIYLAEKTRQLLPADAAARYQAIQWVMFQMGGIGPMFGQVGFFYKFAGREWEDKRPLERYVAVDEAGCSPCSRPGSRAATGWSTSTASPTSRRSAGCEPHHLLRSPRPRRFRQFQECVGVARPRPGAGRAVQRGLTIPARP